MNKRKPAPYLRPFKIADHVILEWDEAFKHAKRVCTAHTASMEFLSQQPFNTSDPSGQETRWWSAIETHPTFTNSNPLAESFFKVATFYIRQDPALLNVLSCVWYLTQRIKVVDVEGTGDRVTSHQRLYVVSRHGTRSFMLDLWKQYGNLCRVLFTGVRSGSDPEPLPLLQSWIARATDVCQRALATVNPYPALTGVRHSWELDFPNRNTAPFALRGTYRIADLRNSLSPAFLTAFRATAEAPKANFFKPIPGIYPSEAMLTRPFNSFEVLRNV